MFHKSNSINLAAKIRGNDMYPPVEIIFTIFFFLKRKSDFKVKNNIEIKLNGRKNNLMDNAMVPKITKIKI